MYILGISAFYHDSAAVIIRDGEIIAGCEEERFTRIKHAFQFPYSAIEACLKIASIAIDDIDCVAYYEKPLLRFERVIDSMIGTYPFSLGQFLKGIPEWMGEKIRVERNIRKNLKFKGEIFFVPHHLSHASSSYFGSGFVRSAIMTVDGIGEYQTSGLWLGEGNKITPIKKIDFPNSLGLLYSTFTAFLGFRINEDEYKVMGLSAYGRPIYKNEIYRMVDVRKDGSFRMDMSYFSFHKEFKMWSPKFEKMFGKQRKPSENISRKHKDLAASIQSVTEEIYFKMLNHLHQITRSNNVCIAGGVGLNALANGKIFENTPFKKVFVIGPAGDSGGAMGTAMFVSSFIKKRRVDGLKSLGIGTLYSDAEIKSVLESNKLKFKSFSSQKDLIEATAKLLASGKILGWFEKEMEFGPRALGRRSILARPFPYSMKEKVNIIKRREQFRPFAGSVLEEEADKFFKLPKTQKSFPFMNFCFQVKDDKKMEIPAITHEDGSSRIQTVNKNSGIYYELIKEFKKLTRIPVVLNTSFNLRGEPIVETPQQAVDDFMATSLDYLVIGNYIVKKS